MDKFTILVLARQGSRQLLYIVESSSISVYDEHTGSTIMRQTACDSESLTSALELLRA
jgi:hypothetical protein